MARTAFLSGIALTSALFAVSGEVWGQGSYFTITDLGTLPDATVSYAADINDQGQIVGFCVGYPDDGDSPPPVVSRAFLWQDGLMLDLGMPEEIPTDPPSDWHAFIQPWAINNAGQVLLFYDGSDDFTRSFVWEDGAVTELVVETSGSQFRAFAINDAGEIFGVVFDDDGQAYAAGWQDGAPYLLEGMEEFPSSCILGANDAGQVVGAVTTQPADSENPISRGFLWESGSATVLDIFGASSTRAYAINEQGQVVGWSELGDGQSRVFLWQDEQMTDLGTLEGYPSSVAYDINSSGQVIGDGYMPTGDHQDPSLEPSSAFLLLPGPAYGLPAGMHNLNDLIAPDSGWVIENVSAINDSGWIAATATSGTDTRAVLLTPPAETAEAEPTGLCGAGLIGLFPFLLLGMCCGKVCLRSTRRRETRPASRCDSAEFSQCITPRFHHARLVILLCFLLESLAGCQQVDLPGATWKMLLTDRYGRIEQLTMSTPELFRDVKSLKIQQIAGTVRGCETAWFDNASGLMATLEHAEKGRTIRLYDRSMNVVAERHLPSAAERRSSCPVLLEGGERVAFVDGTGRLIVGSIGGKNEAQWQETCQLVEVVVTPSSTISWVGDSKIAVESLDKIYMVDIGGSAARLLGEGKLLGVRDGHLVISRFPIGIGLMNLEGKVEGCLGHIGPGRPYSGHRIHRISPDGRYVAYDSSHWYSRDDVLVIQHIESGRQVHLRRPEGIGSLGSWQLSEPTRLSSLPEKLSDGETRCRLCSHILRGLTEPRCPECGERI